MLKFIIGLVCGVWLGAVNPTVAGHIQEGTRALYEWVVNDGADAIISVGETLKEQQPDTESEPDPK